MSIPRMGYLCLSENPTGEAARALVRQFVLVREAERMGYDDIWVGEHHLDDNWPHAGMLPLLGHLVAVTSKARVGAMALMPAWREPVQLAEDLGTLDLLSKGRLEIGIASGAAFPRLLASRGLTPATARQRVRENMDGIQALLSCGPVPGVTDGATLVPRAGQQPLPVWLAADDEANLRHAGERGWGLMAAATHSHARVQHMLRTTATAAGGVQPALNLARFACSCDTREEAIAIARPYFEQLAARSATEGWGADAGTSIARDVEALIAQSLIGSHAEVAQQFKRIGEEFGATHIAIVPTTGQFDTHKHILAAFVDEVRPLLED